MRVEGLGFRNQAPFCLSSWLLGGFRGSVVAAPRKKRSSSVYWYPDRDDTFDKTHLGHYPKP